MSRQALYGDDRRGQDDRATRAHERQCLLDREQNAAHIETKSLVEVLRGYLIDCLMLDEPGVREDDIHSILRLLNSPKKMIQVVEIGTRLRCERR